MSLAIAGTGHRPEMLRRNTVADNARIAIVLSGLLMPFAIYWLIAGSALPFVISATGLVAGMITLSLHQRRLFEHAAAGQVYALFFVGLLLSLASGHIADAGLAIAVMAPVLASLIGRPELRRQSWMILAGFVALAFVTNLLSLPVFPMPTSVLFGTSALSFAVCVTIVLHSSHRISVAFEVYDKSQVNAYRHLIEHVQDAVIRFSSDGEVLLASRTSETLFGCRRYELSGSGLGERMHVLDRPAYLTAFADANQGGKVRTIEVRMRQDDPRATALPRFIWVEVSLSPVLDAATEGVRHEVVALFRDITDRKDNEVAMAEARRAAEEASEAKSRFLATIGHELRTPLNAIVGFSEMMTSGIGGEPSATHKEYAGLIHQSGRHLLEVVRMLLDMSKIEAGKFELQTEPFMPATIVQPCFNMLEAAAQEREIRLVANIASDMPMLMADERSCRQILLNLMSNAIKFSHPGGTVTVSLKRQGQAINLSVSDHGVGMAPDSIKRVGEAFFQEQNGLARQYEGTGLGLSIVKGLVDLHEGTLRAISEIGAGTTMTVLLPINGPATNVVETDTVTPLRREPAAAPIIPWQDEKRKAQ
ncbi:PAS domain-containing sensor histidine kinase [Devosia epidermidihirudinis]|uniref:PAS domain-containing sensor histidine kinase n=1 Tax=Devosia epidermidihirudinis TaxID=1293439 RepID=UPI0018D24EA0|nr:PAS domain-containing sensor histidine kinase [Devosia epidermidihirudinis]